jgi:hypothetical protein
MSDDGMRTRFDWFWLGDDWGISVESLGVLGKVHSDTGGLNRELQLHQSIVIARSTFGACTLAWDRCLHSSRCPYLN